MRVNQPCLQLGASGTPGTVDLSLSSLRTPRGLGWGCDAQHCSGPGAVVIASEKERRSWKHFACIYFTAALFLDLSYFGLEFTNFQNSPETQN